MLLGYRLGDNPCEMYKIEVKGSVFCFSIAKAFFEYLRIWVTDPKIVSRFLAIRREEHGEVVTFFVDLPSITYPNYAHKRLERKALVLCVKEISLLLEFFNWFFPTKDKYEGKFSELFISQEPQLVLIETFYNGDGGYHACPVQVGYNNRICELLAETYKENTDILLCEEAAFTLYHSLSTERKRDFEKAKKEFEKYHGGFIMGFTVRVREMGVPQFSVPGDCACLSENPDRFKHDRAMTSHNLDTPLQQMTLLAAVVSFWNEVLRPLMPAIKIRKL